MTIKRKIIGSSYSKLVCLPKQWVDIYKFKKGDLIEMEMDQRGNLVLKGKEIKLGNNKEKKRSLREQGYFTLQEISRLTGIDEVNVKKDLMNLVKKGIIERREIKKIGVKIKPGD